MFIIDPLQDASWDTLVASNPSTGFFHSSAWARVLHEAYGHRPCYLASVSGGVARAGLPLMEVSSPWTGRRGVSLPFTDFCGPVALDSAVARTLFADAMRLGSERRWKYLEVRCPADMRPDAEPSLSFYIHSISLRGDSEALFSRLESSVRRGIRKAERSKVEVRFETSADALAAFYRLHCETRRRHGVPPQPYRFYESIRRNVLAVGHGTIVTAFHDAEAIAAAIFFRHGGEAIYKFGASDVRHQHVRPNNLLMWVAMQHYRDAGCETLNLGRTSLLNDGLRRFKLGFGAVESVWGYRKFSFRQDRFIKDKDRAEGGLSGLLRLAPSPLFRWFGTLIYPHLS